ncbi:unnamed protein product [Pleuronectes platessa]|uniref:Uncharacterized protein n=1 Tax=Pleuronectes platessa TaxID=8262 RepID=A0A9N7Y4R4_PLEPL|nr:unnamed protein product [Pleuronectes platessa]
MKRSRTQRTQRPTDRQEEPLLLPQGMMGKNPHCPLLLLQHTERCISGARTRPHIRSHIRSDPVRPGSGSSSETRIQCIGVNEAAANQKSPSLSLTDEPISSGFTGFSQNVLKLCCYV